jgi:Ca-activated chloride channel family protein
MKPTLYLIILFLSLAGFKINAIRNISGTVYGSDDKKPLAGVQITTTDLSSHVTTDAKGNYSINVAEGTTTLIYSMIGFETQRVSLGKKSKLNILLKYSTSTLTEVVITNYGTKKQKMQTASMSTVSTNSPAVYSLLGAVPGVMQSRVAGIQISGRNHYSYNNYNTETYKKVTENKFLDASTTPLSTFAVDVDAASYSNIRRMINGGNLPDKEAVRIEEMINYFQYNLAGPTTKEPVAIHTELSYTPWNSQHRLLRIGLKAKSVNTASLPPSNLVFLIDVSGSMFGANRLPLVKSSLKLLVDQLRDVDHVAIVTYAGNAGLKLASTPGNQKMKIKDAIDDLEAGGSTAGGAGIKLAYDIARQNFIKKGNNRIVLATDGDFNVGESSDEDMEDLISRERQSGISLSVFGFGMGNIKDSKMELLADKGHGNYAYIDQISEARKSIVTEFGGTFFTVAKDVKIQVEFNPSKVQAYRLLGYENRLLEKEDFNNDTKLGGDMGVGHTITALYEIIPIGIKDNYSSSVDPLKYQKTKPGIVNNQSSELATVKFRYKNPDASQSKMQLVVINDKPSNINQTSDDFRFASAVAEMGMLLRDSEFKQQSDYLSLIGRAKKAKGTDDEGYRAEFIRLAESARLLTKSNVIGALGYRTKPLGTGY